MEMFRVSSVCFISSTCLVLLAVFEPWEVVVVEIPHWKYSRFLKCVLKSVLEEASDSYIAISALQMLL